MSQDESNEGRLKGPGFKIQTKTKDQGSKAMSQKPQTITKTQRLSFQIQKTKTANKGSRNEVEEPKKCKPKGRIEEAKYNIRKVNKLHPEYTKETLEILDEYEKRSIN